MAFAWFVGFVGHVIPLFESTNLIDGTCYTWSFFHSHVHLVIYLAWYFVSFYVIILIIFIYCYGRILIAIRRQARVMASHGAHASSTSQTQSHQIQTNVIKTMIIVSAFYAIAWLPANVYYLLNMMDSRLTYMNSLWYASMFVAFLYTCANPFIYATKFDPVRRVLIDMIPCKKTSVQPTEFQMTPVRTGGSSEPKRY